MSTIKIIRTFFGDNHDSKKEISPFPTLPLDEIVYVWGEENQKYIIDKGFEIRPVSDDLYPYFNSYHTRYGRKLVALKLALEEFDEVIMLDWDCYLLRPLDNNFYKYLEDKPIQCPLYSHHINTAKSFIARKELQPVSDKQQEWWEVIEKELVKYNWKYKKDTLITPNFGFVYSRDKEFGNDLLDIALEYKLKGCIEEHAMFIYADCSFEEYLLLYQPLVVQGVTQDNDLSSFPINFAGRVQQRFNKHMDTLLNMDLYLKHI